MNLRSRLQTAEVKPPYGLVGHFFGALIVRAFAHAHCAGASAVVMIGPADRAFASYKPRFPSYFQATAGLRSYWRAFRQGREAMSLKS